jgi:hypothetical protein
MNVVNYSCKVPFILFRYNLQYGSVMSVNYRGHVISEFARLHVMKAYWLVEIYAPLIPFTSAVCALRTH